jgi:hypothetical protein
MTPNAEATRTRLDEIGAGIEAQKAAKQAVTHYRGNGDGRRLVVPAYLAAHGITLNGTKSLNNGAVMYLIDCPNNGNHKGKEAGIIQYPNGALAYQCKHETCSSFHWDEFRQAISGDAKLDPWLPGGNGQHGPSVNKATHPMTEAEEEREAIRTEGSGTQSPPAESKEDEEQGIVKKLSGEKVMAGDLMDNEPPEPDPALNDVVDLGDKLAVIAQSKQRKSFFMLQMAFCMVLARSFLKFNIRRPLRVLYVQYEVRPVHKWRRVRRMARALNVPRDALGDNLMIINARGKRRWYGPDGCRLIIKTALEHRADVIIIDPLYKIMEGSERDPVAVKAILDLFDEITDLTNAMLAYVHHDRKGNVGDQDLVDRGAGANQLGRDWDALIALTPHEDEVDGLVVVEIVNRNYEPMDKFVMEFGCIDGGYKFEVDAESAPNKKTSRTTKKQEPLSSYLPEAEKILKAGPMTMGVFRVRLMENSKIKISEKRARDFCRIYANNDSAESVIHVDERRGGGIKGTEKVLTWRGYTITDRR